jgi:hypothetical protein
MMTRAKIPAKLPVVFTIRRSIDPRSGIERRHHVSERIIQNAIKTAIQEADLPKKGSCHTLDNLRGFGAGIPYIMPSALISSSISGQCTPSPSPIIS